MTLSTSRKWGRLARVARDRNPRWKVGQLLDRELRAQGLTPDEIEDQVKIPKSTIYVALANGHMNARNLEAMRRFLGISLEEMSTAVYADFIATPGPRWRAADILDQLRELVDDPDGEEESE